MAWPVTTMAYSAPTTASHPLTADQQEEEERNTKRLKTGQPPQGEDATMEDDTTSGQAQAASKGITTQASSQDMTMDIDSGSSAKDVTNHQYQRPASFNNFNGNALSDEELVYQVLESGAQTYAEVVEFCVGHGVSVSRILEMDLMSRLSFLRAG